MKSQSNSQPDPEAINYLPHTQEPPLKGAASTPSITSKSELESSEDILRVATMSLTFPIPVRIANAKKQLLQLALSCVKVEKRSFVATGNAVKDRENYLINLGTNHAIDTIEQKIRGAFS